MTSTNRQNQPAAKPRRVSLRRLGAIGGMLLMLAFCAGLVHAVVRLFEPQPYVADFKPSYDYEMDAMLAAVEWREVKAEQDRLLAFGSRFMGQPGFYAVEEYIRRAYTDAGLEVYEQENWTVVPKTIERDIQLAEPAGDAKPLPAVTLYPFLPNHLQPMNTPDEGLTGRIVMLTTGTLAALPRFDDCIGLINAADGQHAADAAYDWTRYADMGVRAVIVAHPEGLEKIDWNQVAAPRGGMVSSVPINYVRLAATPEIFQYAGRTVTLRVRTQFENTRNTTLVGVLRAGDSSAANPSDDALVLLTNYDAASILPDLAPGVAQAIPLANQLALVKGLANYRQSLVRDVVFVAFGAQMMAHDGDNNLLKVLNENLQNARRDPLRQLLTLRESGANGDARITQDEQLKIRRQPWDERHQKNEATLQSLESIIALFEDDAFLSDAATTQRAADQLNASARALFDEQISHVLDELTFSLHEPQFQAKLDFLQSGQDIQGPAFQAYLAKKSEYDDAVSLANQSLTRLLVPDSSSSGAMVFYNIRGHWKNRFLELREHHLRLSTHLAQNLNLLDALGAYQKLLVFNNKLAPAPSPTAGRRELLSFFDGAWGVNAHMREMASLLSSARQRIALAHPGLVSQAQFDIPMLNQWHSGDVDRMTRPLSMLSTVEWTVFGYHMCTLLNFDRVESYQRYFTPVDLPFMHDVESLRSCLAVTGEMLLSVAHGNGRFAPIQLGWLKKHFGGRVYASGIGQTLVPRFPLQGAFLASRSFYGQEYSYPGFYEHPIIMTDPYGRYELFNTPSDFWVNHYIWKYGYSPIAALHGRDGLIQWMKDEGENGQRLYKSVNLNWFEGKVDNINIVLFRAAPLSLLDLTNPQKMTDFSGVRILDRDGLSEVGKYCHFRVTPIDGAWVSFVEPERKVFVTLESGSPENDLAKVIRGFLLGAPEVEGGDLPGAVEREIDGTGYFPAATGILDDMSRRMAVSMDDVNQERLAMQRRHGMTDEQVVAYGRKANTLLQESQAPGRPYADAVLEARDSVTYSMLIHPVLRKNIVEAILGILYYLALLVPFVFFFEKMFFCHTDIRKQIAAQAVIFLAVFVLLRVLHPAFGMIRSSLMILLGFIIILISTTMTVFFSGKFKQNIEDLKRLRGGVAGAGVNRFGVIITAFLLGLNNMHRRKVRTLLTCGTLTLLTFAMISFTSTHTNIINEETAVGKAPWHGVLVKRENFKRLTAAEVSAIRAKYRHKFDVCPRIVSLGIRSWLDKQGYNPELEIVYDAGGRQRSLRFDSIIRLTHNEPLRHQIEFSTDTPWFSRQDEEMSASRLCPVMLPDAMADALGIRAAGVESGGVEVRINGRAFLVAGIFTAQSLDDARDLDGRDILPYDIESMAQVHVLEDGEVVADENAPRLDPGKIIIAPFRPDLGIQIPNEKPDSYVSLALSMPGGSYRTMRGEIDTYLEQSERAAYFGLDGVAYRGRRTRKASLSGLAELAIPLLIAALTVLNTMNGSVYERRGEIGIYNAIGIAPRYIFFIFMAEAFVYAVIGTMLGYLLSQSSGKILTALGLTGGMNMSFTSIITIYTSLAVAATVFISTWFPARTAMEIAKPADDAGWSLPEPKGDRLEIELPFMFNAHDRIAVLAFIYRYLEDHGEGGTGRFFSSHPDTEVMVTPAEAIPLIKSTTWLKPYDLGVSQTIAIRMEAVPDSTEHKAWLRIERLTGSRDAWLRLNFNLVSDLRRHLLYWRAFSEKDRHTLFNEARTLFSAAAVN